MPPGMQRRRCPHEAPGGALRAEVVRDKLRQGILDVVRARHAEQEEPVEGREGLDAGGKSAVSSLT